MRFARSSFSWAAATGTKRPKTKKLKPAGWKRVFMECSGGGRWTMRTILRSRGRICKGNSTDHKNRRERRGTRRIRLGYEHFAKAFANSAALANPPADPAIEARWQTVRRGSGMDP